MHEIQNAPVYYASKTLLFMHAFVCIDILEKLKHWHTHWEMKVLVPAWEFGIKLFKVATGAVVPGSDPPGILMAPEVAANDIVW